MRSISEGDLAVVIPLLAAKINDFRQALRGTDDTGLEGDALDAHMDLQDMLQHYEGVLESLRDEYEQALAEGIQLPSFAALVAPFQLAPG